MAFIVMVFHFDEFKSCRLHGKIFFYIGSSWQLPMYCYAWHTSQIISKATGHMLGNFP
jgi:hypothetical protein